MESRLATISQTGSICQDQQRRYKFLNYFYCTATLKVVIAVILQELLRV